MGVPFLAPVAVDWPGTVLAINVGGAVIPILLSFYLLVRYRLWGPGLVCGRHRRLFRPPDGDADTWRGHCGSDRRAAASRRLRRPRSVEALRRARSPISAACIGVLVGADLLNLGALRSLGAPGRLDRRRGHF